MQNRFPPPSSKIQNFQTYRNIPISKLISREVLNSIRRSIYMVSFLNLETTYENKYINDYLIYVS